MTECSKTLIDHVFVSNCDNVKSCNVIPVSLSDHYMIALSLGKVKSILPSNHCYICSRNIKNIDIEVFVNDLDNIPNDDVLCESSTEKGL